MDEFDMKLNKYYLDYYKVPESLNENVNNILNSINRNKYRTKNKKVLSLNFIDRLIKTFVSIIMSLSVLSYGTIKTVELYEKYVQNKTSIVNDNKKDDLSLIISKINAEAWFSYDENFDNGMDKIYYKEGTEIPDVYYRVISNMDQYNNSIEIWKDLPNMNDSSFIENDLVVFSYFEKYHDGLQVEEVYVDENDNTVIKLSDINCIDYEEEKVDKFQFLAVIVPKNLIKDRIVFDVIPGTDYISNYGYTALSNLNKDYIESGKALEENSVLYTIDKAFKGENGNIQNANIIKEFADNVNNGKDCAIRVVLLFDNKEFSTVIANGLRYTQKDGEPNYKYLNAIIRDVIYKDGKFHVYYVNVDEENNLIDPIFMKGGDKLDYIEDEITKNGKTYKDVDLRVYFENRDVNEQIISCLISY